MHRQTGCCDRPPTYAHTAGAAFRLVRATEQPAKAVALLIRPDSYSGQGGGEGTVAKTNSPSCNPSCPTPGATLQGFSQLRLGLYRRPLLTQVGEPLPV